MATIAVPATGQKLRGSTNRTNGCAGSWCDGVPEDRFAVLVEKDVIITIGESKSNEKCVQHPAPVVCSEDAAEAGRRVKDAQWEEKIPDLFVITARGTEVCARRTDKDEGWNLPLKIRCTKATSASEEKCMCLTNNEDTCNCQGCSESEQMQTCSELLGPCTCQRSESAICSCSGYCHTKKHRQTACETESGCKW